MPLSPRKSTGESKLANHSSLKERTIVRQQRIRLSIEHRQAPELFRPVPVTTVAAAVLAARGEQPDLLGSGVGHRESAVLQEFEVADPVEFSGATLIHHSQRQHRHLRQPPTRAVTSIGDDFDASAVRWDPEGGSLALAVAEGAKRRDAPEGAGWTPIHEVVSEIRFAGQSSESQASPPIDHHVVDISH